MSDPAHALTGTAYIIGFIAALLLTFLPPEGFPRYTKAGAAHFTWTGKTTRWGRLQWWLSFLGPVLLAVSFGLQLAVWWFYV